MEVMKESRRIAQKLHAVKTLGEAESADEEARLWVEKMRTVEKEREMAGREEGQLMMHTRVDGAQILAEMDEEFGVSNLVDATFKQEKEK
eukprot:Em0151g1a